MNAEKEWKYGGTDIRHLGPFSWGVAWGKCDESTTPFYWRKDAFRLVTLRCGDYALMLSRFGLDWFNWRQGANSGK